MIKDSGERTKFESGAVRDIERRQRAGCDLLPAAAILRLARHYEEGAKSTVTGTGRKVSRYSHL